MGRHRNARIITSPAAMRAAARRGEWHGSTGGQCPAYQQANLVILPEEAAAEFAAFCTRNPKPCPLIEITPPGDPEPARSAPGADLRTDLPGYRVYRGASSSSSGEKSATSGATISSLSCSVAA
jgi:uncharacterized protein YcsI (UPF0317 family)